MVGPGEVDEELEPEVKEECNKKYGDVTKVVIHEFQNTTPEESVRIFIEFKRVESAIKGIMLTNYPDKLVPILFVVVVN
jgi:splicing factor 45